MIIFVDKVRVTRLYPLVIFHNWVCGGREVLVARLFLDFERSARVFVITVSSAENLALE